MLDSTGLQLFGQGEWDAHNHGRTRRQWRKLHLAVDADPAAQTPRDRHIQLIAEQGRMAWQQATG